MRSKRTKLMQKKSIELQIDKSDWQMKTFLHVLLQQVKVCFIFAV